MLDGYLWNGMGRISKTTTQSSTASPEGMDNLASPSIPAP